MNFGIIVFPGTTGHQDLQYVIESILDATYSEIWHQTEQIPETDLIIIPGGYSFADYLRPGAIASRTKIIEQVKAFAHKGGFVLGIGNGFQILCESGMLPGSLQKNNNQSFIGKNIFIKGNTNDSGLTCLVDKSKALKIPIAQSYGRYFAREEDLIELHQNDLILFRYCDESGKISIQNNPGGSTDNIASICNLHRNVYGIIPHPERACDDELGNTDGRIIFESIIKWIG
jgi:phosphoribosylformylglycinamidine synthase